MMENGTFDFEEAKKQKDEHRKKEEEGRLKTNHAVLSKNNLIEDKVPAWASSCKTKNQRKKIKKKRFPSGKVISISNIKASVRYLKEENIPKNLSDAKVIPFNSNLKNIENERLLKSIGVKAFPQLSLPSNYIQSVLVDSKKILVSFIDKYGTGLSSSLDGGNTWITAERSIWNNINKLFIGNDKAIYIESSSLLNGDLNPSLRSSQNGKSWIEIVLPKCTSGETTKSFVGFSGEVYAGTSEGLFISKDKGISWQHLIPSNWLVDKKVLFISQARCTKKGMQTVLYVVTNSGLIISSDEGLSWQKISSDAARFCTAFLIDGNGTIFLGLGKHGIYFSSDVGKTWQSKNSGDGLCKGPIRDIKAKNELIYISHGSEDCDGLSKGGGLSVSIDGGKNFTNIRKENSPVETNDLGSLFIGPSGTIYASTMGSGLLISDYRLHKWLSLVVESTGVLKSTL